MNDDEQAIEEVEVEIEIIGMRRVRNGGFFWYEKSWYHSPLLRTRIGPIWCERVVGEAAIAVFKAKEYKKDKYRRDSRERICIARRVHTRELVQQLELWGLYVSKKLRKKVGLKEPKKPRKDKGMAKPRVWQRIDDETLLYIGPKKVEGIDGLVVKLPKYEAWTPMLRGPAGTFALVYRDARAGQLRQFSQGTAKQHIPTMLEDGRWLNMAQAGLVPRKGEPHVSICPSKAMKVSNETPNGGAE